MPVQGTPLTQVHYSARADTEAIFGSVNLAAWADKNNDGNAGTIAATIDAAQTTIDNRIAARAAQLRAPVPVVGSPQYSELVAYHATAVGVILYMGRGEVQRSQTTGDQGAGDYNAMLDQAESDLDAALLANRAALGVTGTWETAPAAIASGTNVAAADRWGNQPYLWGWGAWWPGVWG